MRMRKIARIGLGLVAAATALSAVAVPAASASTAALPSVHLKLFAAAPAGYTNPDDITRLGDVLFVAYQNGAQSDGSPAGVKSNVVGFDLETGKIKYSYVLPGKVDGLTADGRHHRVLVTVNEDLNSGFYTITPSEDGAEAVKQFSYSPSPAETGSDGTNGGTDAISISSNGTIYVAHSNPDVSQPGANNTAAVYTVKLSGSTAKLTPVFGVNDTAAVINPAAGAPATAPLGLTDPDSNRWVPGKDGGTLIQDAQADSKLVYVSDLDAKKPTVRQLNLTNAVTPSGGAATPQLDDIIQPGSTSGDLYVADQGTGAIYRAELTHLPHGTLFASQPAPKSGDLPNDPALAVVDQRTGVVTHLSVGVTLANPKGLVFIPAAHHGKK
ncbi:hypothetical protein [Kitasatospora sp. GAS204B]|uniref:hypothetical protein n=1 Tax=unclassified Kitasatospora TaxID=2633591 RepID=UPI00247567BD|nr:hypothetical protein [Kitasatospora sp. GAS204B]MDH6122043.1 hypothetical protein [Kitasatospora sp. GAS204B]